MLFRNTVFLYNEEVLNYKNELLGIQYTSFRKLEGVLPVIFLKVE